MGSLTATAADVKSVLLFDPQEAALYGLNEAIILSQMRYWLGRPSPSTDDRTWIYGSYNYWLTQFPFWSKNTLIRVLASLEKLGLIVSETRRTACGKSCKHYRLGSPGSSEPKTAVPNMGIGCTQNGYMQYKDSETSLDLPPVAAPVNWAAKLAELEGNLPQSHSIPLLWEALKDARRGENKTGKVSDSVFASLLTEIIALELSPEQLAHGMARGVPNKTYIAKVGRKFVPSPPKPGQITEAFNPYANIVCKD